MAVITFTQADVMANKTLDRCWCGMRLSKIDGPTTSAKGNSFNYLFVFTLDEDSPAPGKEIRQTFNTKMMHKMLPVVAAIKEVPVESLEGAAIDLEELVGSDLDGEVIPDVYLGQPTNSISMYLPYGKGTARGNNPSY